MRELTHEEVLSVRQQGYVIARSVLTDTELAAVHCELKDYFPGWVDHCRSPDKIELTPAGRAVPGFVEFPFTGVA